MEAHSSEVVDLVSSDEQDDSMQGSVKRERENEAISPPEKRAKHTLEDETKPEDPFAKFMFKKGRPNAGADVTNSSRRLEVRQPPRKVEKVATKASNTKEEECPKNELELYEVRDPLHLICSEADPPSCRRCAVPLSRVCCCLMMRRSGGPASRLPNPVPPRSYSAITSYAE